MLIKNDQTYHIKQNWYKHANEPDTRINMQIEQGVKNDHYGKQTDKQRCDHDLVFSDEGKVITNYRCGYSVHQAGRNAVHDHIKCNRLSRTRKTHEIQIVFLNGKPIPAVIAK